MVSSLLASFACCSVYSEIFVWIFYTFFPSGIFSLAFLTTKHIICREILTDSVNPVALSESRCVCVCVFVVINMIFLGGWTRLVFDVFGVFFGLETAKSTFVAEMLI